jgi:hypothetical protein
MDEALTHHIARQFVAGAGRAPIDAESRRMVQLLAREREFLNGFAFDLEQRLAERRPITEAYVANRSQLYGGSGRTAWFYGNEKTITQSAGTVVYYEATDDKGTCSNCHDAEGKSPYLIGNHPWPGTICVAGGRCRCRLRYQFEPSTWERLSGRKMAK